MLACTDPWSDMLWSCPWSVFCILQAIRFVSISFGLSLSSVLFPYSVIMHFVFFIPVAIKTQYDDEIKTQ